MFVFRTLDDCREIAEYAKGKKSAAVIGGGLLGLEAARGLQNFGLEVNVVHLGGHLMQQQLDAVGRRHSPPAAWRRSGSRVHALKEHNEAFLATTASTACGSPTARRSNATWSSSPPAFKPNWDIAAGMRSHGRARRLSSTTRCVRSTTATSTRSANAPSIADRMYGLVAPLWEQAKVLADHVTGTKPRGSLSRLESRDQAQGDGRGSGLDGHRRTRYPEDEVVQFSEPKRGTYKKLIIRDGRLVGGILLGDISKAAYLMQAFDRNTPLPEERLRLLFDIGDPPKQVTFEEMSADTQICNCNGVSKGALVACVNAGKRTAKAVMDATRAGMGCGSCKSAGRARSSSGPAAAKSKKIRRCTTTCPVCRSTKPELIRGHPRAQSEIRVCGLRLPRRRQRRRRAASPVSRRC